MNKETESHKQSMIWWKWALSRLMVLCGFFFILNLVYTETLYPHDIQKYSRVRNRIDSAFKEGDIIYFKEGNYNEESGLAEVKKMKLPILLQKMEKLHKATTESPLYYLNLFFGASLLFFVLSSFWMFTPKMPVFKKGMYFALAGAVLTIVMLFV